jgi:EAL domain-containing protein (putative c-di-GMP-specific phosphodiesterase class I)
MPKDILVAVNLSPVQFAKSNVVEAAMFAIADSGLAEERLELEITEGVLLEESAQNLATLRQLKDIGVSIALDDFGVGFSSLAYLTAFPFDKVKIDLHRPPRPAGDERSDRIDSPAHDLAQSIDRGRRHRNTGAVRPRAVAWPQIWPRLSIFEASAGERTEVRASEQSRQE